MPVVFGDGRPLAKKGFTMKTTKVRGSVSRRTVLGGVAAATAMAGIPRRLRAQGARNVKLSLPWVAEGSSLFTFVARHNGYWAKHGLNVEIVRGSGSVAAAQAVATGQFDFSFPAASASILQVVKGLPMVMLGAFAYDATQGVAVPVDSPIKTPKDLEGKKMGSVVASGEYPFLPAFAERAGFDLSKVDIQQVDVQIRERLLADKQVDAISGFGTSIIPSLASKGFETRMMLYSKYGITNYGNTLVTRPEVLQKDPALCEAMIDGCMQAIKFCLLNPKEASDIFFQEVPEMAMSQTAHEQIRIGLGVINVVALSATAKEKGLGFMDPAAMKDMTDLTLKYIVKDGKAPEIDTLYTNQFVGKIKLTGSELQTAQTALQDFTKYLS
jgi:ABC-type nitrate/sulfonate/bicarbonate transport system substrate-binding protein